MMCVGFGPAYVSATLRAFPSRLTDGAMILVVGLSVDCTCMVASETDGPVKVTLTMRAHDVG